MTLPLEVDIREEIHVERSGDADCIRHYTFLNKDTSPSSLPSVIRVELPPECQVGKIYISDDRLHEISVKGGLYHLAVDVSLGDKRLDRRVTLSIPYKWPSFVPPAIEASYRQAIRLSHPFSFKYELELDAADPGLLATPVFTVHPPESFARERPVVRTAKEGFLFRTWYVPPDASLVVSIFGRPRGPELPVLAKLGEECSP